MSLPRVMMPRSVFRSTSHWPLLKAFVRRLQEICPPLSARRLMYLPSYIPDFNPIEHAFAKLKALLHSAAARTIPDLWAAIRQLSPASPGRSAATISPQPDTKTT